MDKSDSGLWDLARVIVTDNANAVSQLLAATPALAIMSFHTGASRQNPKPYYLTEIERYIWAGDTTLHIAAAAYQAKFVQELIANSASVHAMNRHGEQPLHSACVGIPGSHRWDPSTQVATIIRLIESGADPNAVDKHGVTPLHRAVRTRCAAVVQVLLEHGADPTRQNKSGSTPLLLAMQNTGRSGSGSLAAKAQQAEILHLLKQVSS